MDFTMFSKFEVSICAKAAGFLLISRPMTDCPAQCVNNVNKLCFVCAEVGGLLLADFCCALQVGLTCCNIFGKLINLGTCCFNVGICICDLCLQLRLFCFGSLDLKLLVGRCFLTPFREF